MTSSVTAASCGDVTVTTSMTLVMTLSVAGWLVMQHQAAVTT